MSSRKALLEHLAEIITALAAVRPIVAVDGVDGSGKTTFADELAPMIAAHGRPVVRASVDGFHHPRSIRYRRGRADPEGYFLDSYDYGSLIRELIQPFRLGTGSIRTAVFDHNGDQAVASIPFEAAPDAVLLLDGIFLNRNELQGLWDLSIFLQVPFEISFRRMAERDNSSPDPSAEGNYRYIEGQSIYLRTCKPHQRASFLIDNSDFDSAVIIKNQLDQR